MGGVPGGPREWEWFHPEVVGPAPAPRTGHAACLLGDGKTILVQGGWDPQDAASEATKVCGGWMVRWWGDGLVCGCVGWGEDARTIVCGGIDVWTCVCKGEGTLIN